jgi:class 3 adenylate cyclase
MAEIAVREFEEPDEVVELPGLSGAIVVVGESYVGRFVHKPGWRWSKDIKPLVGTPSCPYHHQGIVLSGRMVIQTDEGARRTLSPGEVFDVPPGHDGWVVGDAACITIEFRGARDWARPRIDGERVLATLLFTDLVGSTALAARMGDAAWKELLARHYDRVRRELERFRGHEVKTTGDGLLILFDGAARALRCGAAIARVARLDGVEVRIGVHSGEIERHTDGVHGMGVHLAARIMALAGPGEVLVSASTVALLEGAGLAFEDAGEHALKGVPGPRRIYRLLGEADGSQTLAATIAPGPVPTS